jgi:Xaa-Pro aminopeptidase
MPAVLICGDTMRSPELRHEVPLGIGDPFLYLEVNGRRAVVTNVLEVDRIAKQAPDLERILGEELGIDELIAQGMPRSLIEREIFVRAVQRLGIGEAVVPPDFPLALADRLREAGVVLSAGATRPTPSWPASAARRTPRWRAWRSARACSARPRSTATGCATTARS